MTKHLTIMGLKISVSDTCVHIEDSYKADVKVIRQYILEQLLKKFPEITRYNRTFNNMMDEWTAHNILYERSVEDKRTKSVDFELKQSFLQRLGFWFIAHFFRERNEYEKRS